MPDASLVEQKKGGARTTKTRTEVQRQILSHTQTLMHTLRYTCTHTYTYIYTHFGTLTHIYTCLHTLTQTFKQRQATESANCAIASLPP